MIKDSLRKDREGLAFTDWRCFITALHVHLSQDEVVVRVSDDFGGLIIKDQN